MAAVDIVMIGIFFLQWLQMEAVDIVSNGI